MELSYFEWLGHAAVFFLSGFTYWLIRAGRDSLGTVFLIGLAIVGVYFLGWWALLTWFFGVLFAMRMYARALQSGKDPFKNPWRQP